jgi:NADPH-dependent 2,4-dienoyl-CoA reductase/sulfur reductase-like enzyme
MTIRRVVIVGASLAGVSAAEALREAGFDGQVLLAGAERVAPYDRPPLSKEALRDGCPPQLRDPGWYAQQGIDLILGGVAIALDPQRRVVTFGDGTELGYDGLVIATGSQPRPLPSPLDAPGVHVLRTAQDCVALREALRGARRLLVVGAGFIGLEVAATARQMGVEVTVVEVTSVPLGRVLGDEVGDWFATRHREHGIELRCSVTVKGVTGGPGDYRVRLSDGRELVTDVILAGVGVEPATGWLSGSGITVSDGVLCDAYCRTSAPDVVAAGDVARWYNPLFDEQMRIEHWTNAVEQGRAAALTLISQAPGPYAPAPYFWSDQFDARIRFVGRAYAAEDVRIVQRDERSLVALYGRDGAVRGALCVNSPRALAVHRRQIDERVAWEDVVGAATA